MVRRIYTEKKMGFDQSAKQLQDELLNVLDIEVEGLREFIRYDVEGISDEDFEIAKYSIFVDKPTTYYLGEDIGMTEDDFVIVIEYLPGQFDQRADSAVRALELANLGDKSEVKSARVIAISGIDEEQFETIKNYLINPIEARMGSMEKPFTIFAHSQVPEDVKTIDNFITLSKEDLLSFHKEQNFAMSANDLIFVRNYFNKEHRNPTETELKVIDTYWSDHCRHTTFNTEIDDIKIISDNPHIEQAMNEYNELFATMYEGRTDKYFCMMDIATIGMKKLKKEGLLDNLDESDEINACSVVVPVDNDGEIEEWLIMFKNETHNHPTEMEPFGGAATCLGGAIRDPLSGRTWAYQGMRVTGCGDPTVPVSETLKGKLPQRYLTQTAAKGFSSYSNQIGLATGMGTEIYHERYRAKRMEAGYIIAGAPRENVVRRKPIPGDVIILLGGETGRDGLGGATGSSKAHTMDSFDECSAEVQKGNAMKERNIQRLFRNPGASQLIVKCNDFGAGGVSVAIGELADSLDIYLDRVPVKYEGLSATELAISESQERMAVVIAKENVDQFTLLAAEENLSATQVAFVTDSGRMKMFYEDKMVLDLSREFLDSNGVRQHTNVIIEDNTTFFLDTPNESVTTTLEDGEHLVDLLKKEISKLNVCSQKGILEMFDTGAGTDSILQPLGGAYQLTPAQVMAAKPPVSGYTDTATVSSFACYPYLSEQSPFLGSVYAIVGCVTKLVVAGVPYKTIRLSLQEYFKRLGNDAKRWGEPVSALLGAFYAQTHLGIGAIGGKDSMSGTFEDIDVPPTLIAFGMGVGKASTLISNTFEGAGRVYRIRIPRDEFGMPDFERLKTYYDRINNQIEKGTIISASVVEDGGVVAAVIKSCMGNGLGFRFPYLNEDMFTPCYGDIIVQVSGWKSVTGLNAESVGEINLKGEFIVGSETVSYDEIKKAYTSTLEDVFPTTCVQDEMLEEILYSRGCNSKQAGFLYGAPVPKVLVPIFPGTHGEYEVIKMFEEAGAKALPFVIKNKTKKDIEDSVDILVDMLENTQILALCGGATGGYEPDGTAKFITALMSSPKLKDAVSKLIHTRDGLVFGIDDGFAALVRLGLLPFGEFRDFDENSPILAGNTINRFVNTVARVKITSNNSPWLNGLDLGGIYNAHFASPAGKFIANDDVIDNLIANGQIAGQYVDMNAKATMEYPFNPSGSMLAIESLVSPNGRILGKMTHPERGGDELYKNISGDYDMRKLFLGGVKFFT